MCSRAFNSNFENQKLAYNAARKAFDLTSNQAGYIPDFSSRFNDFGFNFMMPFEMPNSAYAGAAVGPGFSHQVAALNPENPVSLKFHSCRYVNVIHTHLITSLISSHIV